MKETTTIGSRLFYYGTNIQVQLGDNLIWKRLFGRKLKGTVVSLPGISPQHADLETGDFRDWAIELEDGSVLRYLYSPQQAQPKRNLKFIAGGAPNSLSPNERLQ